MPRYTRDVPAEYSEFERSLAEAFGARVRQRRQAQRLTQEQVRIRMETESVSITRDRYSRIEMGKALANAAEIFALAAALDVSYPWLLEGKEPVEAGE
ncbi:MAG: helix-turn-helix domain-containing protein [Chloroflexales bacterium]|nr:helix-turn-helix domain-containing protein [Chloroflexales bacterium]